MSSIDVSNSDLMTADSEIATLWEMLDEGDRGVLYLAGGSPKVMLDKPLGETDERKRSSMPMRASLRVLALASGILAPGVGMACNDLQPEHFEASERLMTELRGADFDQEWLRRTMDPDAWVDGVSQIRLAFLSLQEGEPEKAFVNLDLAERALVLSDFCNADLLSQLIYAIRQHAAIATLSSTGDRMAMELYYSATHSVARHFPKVNWSDEAIIGCVLERLDATFSQEFDTASVKGCKLGR
ncbi:hypothetical protein ACW9UR_23810 [Halovulum sp. GXIMD14794]